MHNKYLYWIVGALIQLTLSVQAAQAITVSPVLHDFEIEPGNNERAVISLLNDTNRGEDFHLEVKNFVAIGEEGHQEYLDEDVPTDLASWVVVEKPSVYLEAGESADFQILINVPDDAEPGGHYATVFFSRGKGDAEESGVGVVEQVGVLLLVRVPGDVKEGLSVETFRVKDAGFLNRLPVEFELRVRNEGSVHVRPAGDIVVNNMFGNVVARVPVNPKKAAALPDSVRRIESIWTKTFDEDVETGFFAELKNEWTNFALGKYTATLDATYGSQSVKLDATQVTFWVWPWRLIATFIFLLIALILLIKGYNALVVRAAMKKAK